MTQQNVEEMKWRSNWHYILARMLEQKPVLFSQENVYLKLNQGSGKKGQAPRSVLLPDTKIDQFSCGYHFFNCMMALFKRKEDLMTIIKCYQKHDGSNLMEVLSNETNDMVLTSKSKMLGREFTLARSSNPLLDVQSSTGVSLSALQTQSVLEKLKLMNQLKNIGHLNQQIIQSGNLALCFYKAKNQLLTHLNTGNNSPYKYLKVSCKRMIQLIYYNLSEHVFQLKQEQDLMSQGDPILKQLYSDQDIAVTDALVKEALKNRDQVTTHLITDGWDQQAILFLEQNREFQKNLHLEQQKPADFFNYEMQILNYNKSLSKQERCERFKKVIEMDYH